jgi:GT2 family glycosyltransferase
MQVSFIIPLYNCLGHTRECLRTLQSTLPAGLAHEIILVDDGSTDGTRKWLSTLGTPCRALLNEKNLGFAGACNRAAAAATGELLFFLNNDLVLLPGWFEPMRDAFARFADAGLVGNIQLNAASGAIDHAGIYFTHTGKPAHDTSRPAIARLSGYRAVPAVTGACLAIRRDRWLELGGFDTAFVNGGEDVDLALRAADRGLRHYVALRSVVRHHISASAGRKLRDEQNSRLLATRWREAIAPLAGRDWCREFIERHWELSCQYDDVLAREVLYYWLGLLPNDSSGVMAGVRQAMRREEQRWRELLGAQP